MTTKIKADVQELTKINQEIKRLAIQMKQLRERKKKIEKDILAYMEQTGNHGLVTIRAKDVEITTAEKKTRQRLSKEEKENTAIQLLQQSGVSNPKKTYRDLQEMLKGKEEIHATLKVKDNKPVSSSKLQI